MDVEHKTVVALKWSVLAKLLGQLISWGVTLIVLRLLAPADYGLMAIVTVIVSIIAGLAEFGFGASLIQAPKLDRRELSRIAGALGALNIGCGVLVAAAAPLAAAWLGEPRLELLIQISALQFLFAAIEIVPQALVHRELDFARVARIEIAATVVGSLGTLALALAGAGVWALVLGGLAGTVARASAFVLLGGFVWPSLDLKGIGHHIRFGGIVTVTRMFWQITYQMDTLIAARFFSRETLGLYSVAMHLATLPMSKAMGIVNQVAFPAVARLQDELPRLRLRLLESLRLLAFIAIASLWGTAAVAEEFVDVVLGEKWHAAETALQLVSAVAPLRMLMAVLATALAASGHADLELRNTIASALILPASFAIGVHWGLNGLAASWLIAVPVICVVNFRRTAGPLGLTVGDVIGAVRGPLIAGAAMFAAVSLVRLCLAGYEEAVRLPVLIVTGALAYLASAWALDRGIWIDVRRVAAALRG
jgi:O-antigen/teichoic acid export membrane protein